MAISSCSKQPKNTTEELGESSMVILLPLNFPYENRNYPLMFCRARSSRIDSQQFTASSMQGGSPPRTEFPDPV
jgi:hypothetical protein